MSWRELIQQAEASFHEGRHHDALQLCDRAAVSSPEARYSAAMLRGDVLMDLGDSAGALSSYDSVADPAVPDPELDCQRGVALFDCARLAEAENALRSAIRGNPDLAEAHYVLALIAEITNSGREMEHFRAARRLDPVLFPAVVQMSRPEFEAVVEEAMATLPENVRQQTRGVPVLIAEVPHPSDLAQGRGGLSPRALGTLAWAPRAGHIVSLPAAPDRPTLLLFKRNIERSCVGEEQMVERIRQTVIQEVATAVGLSAHPSGDAPLSF